MAKKKAKPPEAKTPKTKTCKYCRKRVNNKNQNKVVWHATAACIIFGGKS